MTIQQVLEHLLQTNAPELQQQAYLSIDINGETHVRPMLSIHQLTQPIFMTPEGLCPLSGLSESDKEQHLEQVLDAGQLLFTYAEEPVHPTTEPDYVAETPD